MKSGIYMIECRETGKMYIGQSVNMKSRYQKHLADLKSGAHGNPYLKHAFSKHGKNAFKFSILEYCEKELLLEREYFWISYYDTTNGDKGFNIIFDSKREKDRAEKCNSAAYRDKMKILSTARWQDPEYAKKNIEGIKKAHEERKARGENLAIHTEEAKRKSYEACHTPEFLNSLSKRSKEQLKDPRQREIALNNLNKGRKSPLWLENIRKSKQDPEYKKMIAEKTRLSWIKRREKNGS